MEKYIKCRQNEFRSVQQADAPSPGFLLDPVIRYWQQLMRGKHWSFYQTESREEASILLILSKYSQACLFCFSLSNLFWELAPERLVFYFWRVCRRWFTQCFGNSIRLLYFLWQTQPKPFIAIFDAISPAWRLFWLFVLIGSNPSRKQTISENVCCS